MGKMNVRAIGELPEVSKVSMIKRLDGYIQSLTDGVSGSQTISSYARCIQRYIEWHIGLHGIAPDKLRRKNIVDFKSYMTNIRKYSAGTVNLHISALKSLNEYLVNAGFQKEKVIRHGDRAKEQSGKTKTNELELAEVERFRQSVLEGKGEHAHAIVTIMAYAGLRCGEVVNMLADDIAFASGEIIVRNNEGGVIRTVNLNDKIANAVREYLKERYSDSLYLFESRQNQRLSKRRVNQICNEHSDLITPHKLMRFYYSQARSITKGGK